MTNRQKAEEERRKMKRWNKNSPRLLRVKNSIIYFQMLPSYSYKIKLLDLLAFDICLGFRNHRNRNSKNHLSLQLLKLDQIYSNNINTTHCSDLDRPSSTMYDGPCNAVCKQNSFICLLTFFRTSIMLPDQVPSQH